MEHKPESHWHWRNHIPFIIVIQITSHTRQIAFHVTSSNGIDIFVQLNHAEPAVNYTWMNTTDYYYHLLSHTFIFVLITNFNKVIKVISIKPSFTNQNTVNLQGGQSISIILLWQPAD